MTVCVHNDGDKICKENDDAHDMHIILAGTVIVSKMKFGNDIQVKRFENAGFFGDFALLQENGKRTATCTASCLPGEPVVTLRLSSQQFKQILPFHTIKEMKARRIKLMEANNSYLEHLEQANDTARPRHGFRSRRFYQRLYFTF